MSHEDEEIIKQTMKQVLENFSSWISGRSSVFWDLVIISAADEDQEECYNLQIEALSRKNLLPKAKFHVIADPEGPVVGAGGSTVRIIKILHDTYGEDLFGKKVLLMHSGGSSKRLPNLSCIGKLFAPLPVQFLQGGLFTIFHMKLAITLPFAKYLKNGGLFITACDDIETYSLEGLEDLGDFPDDAVVALAHPSNLYIGQTHGVYVVRREDFKENATCWRSRCLEVLQKPDMETMREKRAIFVRDSEEYVYTDSMFWCGPEVVRRFLKLSDRLDILLSDETCVYADLLTCMGESPKSQKLYFQNISKTSKAKNLLAEEFHTTPLNVVVLERSHFYHLGTMVEYIENLSRDSTFFQSFPMLSIINCNAETDDRKTKGTAMHCFLHKDVTCEKNSVLDFCKICVPLRIGKNCILSNCLISNDFPVADIPSNFLFHTAVLKVNGVDCFVTVAFNIHDDLKALSKKPEDVKYNGKLILELGIPASCLWKDSHLSLWTAKLFEAKSSMEKSFSATFHLTSGQTQVSGTRFSMSDIVKLKSVNGFLRYREDLLSHLKQ